MRTNIKNDEYFNEFLKLNYEDIEFYEKSLASGELKENRIPAIKYQIFRTALHTIIAKYSAGFDISEVKNSFLQLIPLFEQGWIDDSNNQSLASDDKIYFDGYL